MKTLLKIIIIALPVNCLTQLNENFTDGDFTNNPSWQGTTTDFLVNTQFELQTNTAVAATSYLNTSHGLNDLSNKEWRIKVKMSFSPSASNFGRFYLTANGSSPSVNPDGFYLQLGEAGSADAIRLFKQQAGTSTLICSGNAGDIANSFIASIQVLRTPLGEWSLYTDMSGGTNYVFQSSGIDTTNLLGTYVIWQATYTASNAMKFSLDNIYAGDEIVDVTAPILLSATVVNQNQVKIVFNEDVDQIFAEDLANYDLQPFNSIALATRNATDPKIVLLNTTSPMQNGNTYTLFAYNMADASGNDTVSQSVQFFYLVSETPQPGDVIINEFMADPSPAVGMPELEFVEIYNKSAKYFDLKKWKLGDASGDGTVATGILGPGEFKVLCATSSASLFIGSVGVTSFPSLNNSADDIVLKDSNGFVLDRLSYTDAWYKNDLKKVGGYTLERINPNHPCSNKSNWLASNHESGGTPNQVNSVFDDTADILAPSLLKVLAEEPNKLILNFSELIDSASFSNAIIICSPVLSDSGREILYSQSDSATVFIQGSITRSVEYMIQIDGVKDCSGNSNILSAKFILPDDPQKGDLIINEILFDPLTGGSDYVEVMNISQKVLDVKNWKWANISGDSIANKKTITSNFLFRPNELLVFSKDTTNVKNNYSHHEKGRFVQTELPSYNNDSGIVILLANNTVMDCVSYLSKWHFGLLDSKDGKALERISPLASSDEKDNWHTAAESINFGSPGRPNSQYLPHLEKGEVYFQSNVFSPDNDGYEDVLQINYRMAEYGLLAKITIYDQYGMSVRKLRSNDLIGNEGFFVWDGINDAGYKASIGQYIVVFEAFKIDGGQTFIAKKACVLAGKL